VCIAAFVGYLSSMKAETKRIAIHDESGLFVKEFIAQNNSKSEYKYLDLSLIDAQFLKDSITNENYEGIDSENGQCSRFRK
jgi:ABC-2 type transport system permease protein